nr:AAA family ATPase [uncultured Merdimonas sp.]
MGKFPVISISLKSVDGRSFESASAALKTVIGNEAMRFQFLKESEMLSEEEKEAYARLIKIGFGEDGIYAMTEKVAAASLQTLSQLLARHYGQKAILLIDEYDVPLDKAFQAGDYDEMVNLIRNLLGNALKTNDSLYFAVLTGCPRISKESIFTGLNNLKAHTISDIRHDHRKEVCRRTEALGREKDHQVWHSFLCCNWGRGIFRNPPSPIAMNDFKGEPK